MKRASGAWAFAAAMRWRVPSRLLFQDQISVGRPENRGEMDDRCYALHRFNQGLRLEQVRLDRAHAGRRVLLATQECAACHSGIDKTGRRRALAAIFGRTADESTVMGMFLEKGFEPLRRGLKNLTAVAMSASSIPSNATERMKLRSGSFSPRASRRRLSGA